MTGARIEVPATSANLGPGFDTLAIALDIVDTITVDLEEDGEEVALVRADGEAGALDRHDNLICRAYRSWAEDTGTRLPGACFSLESRIPIGKGFGSSAACIVAGLAAAAHAAGDKNPRERILRLATTMEGHADNVAAAALGGVSTAFCDDRSVHALNVANHLSIGIGLYVPAERLPTAKARAALPRTVPHSDAVFNIGRASYLVTALMWGRWEEIGPAMQDRLHQRYRARLIPALDGVIAAAVEGGAYGAALSGGGPSVLALGPRDRAEEFTAAMEEAARRLHWSGHGMVTRVRHLGVQVTSSPLPPAEEDGDGGDGAV